MASRPDTAERATVRAHRDGEKLLTETPVRVFISPHFDGPDAGDGGIRRVVEVQRRFLPACGIEVVDDMDSADILVAHITMPSEYVRYPEKPLIIHNHGLYWAEFEWLGWAEKANVDCLEAIRQADAITAPSEWVAQAIRRASLRNVTVIGHGLSLDDWPERSGGMPDAPFVLWNKTRVDPVCDPQDMVLLAQRCPDISFVSTFGAAHDNILLTGKLSYDLAKPLTQQCAVYLATARETFGIATIEAMASGAPVLGWRWGGQAEFIEHKINGYLARPGDYEDLEAGLRWLLEKENWEFTSAAARATVEQNFQGAAIGQQYANLYRQVHEEKVAERPTVSVVVPAYNLAEFLPEALDSVLAQTMDSWECIIVDDASTDDTNRIARQYRNTDSRFRLLHTGTNRYLAGALNYGISDARGRYIIPLDADNIMAPHALEILSDALNRRRDLDIVYGNVEFLEPDGRRWHSGWPPQFSPEGQVFRRRDDGGPSNLIPSTSMYRKRVWELTGGYRQRYRTGEDADFWTRATSFGFTAEMTANADIFTYRNREGSMSRVETPADWTLWLPWVHHETFPPAAFKGSAKPVMPSFEPVLVSVVIPVGAGHEDLLRDALDSVEAQTFRLWECIVVNDTVDEWSPSRLPSWARLLNTPGERGVAAARNIGIDASKAGLIVFLDADDTLEPEALRIMYEVQKRYGGYVYSDFYERWEGKPPTIWETEDYDTAKLLTHGCLHAVTAMYPRAALDKIHGFDETLPAWEDWDLQLALANASVCAARIPLPLFTYRKDTGMRREANYANFSESKDAIHSKWLPFFSGKEHLMGCSSCSGGRASAPAPMQQFTSSAPPPPSELAAYMYVEYIGGKEAAMNYRAPSGQTYRFSASAPDKVKYVLATDADFFRGRADFSVHSIEAATTA